jgi:hypothetical protein
MKALLTLVATTSMAATLAGVAAGPVSGDVLLPASED